MYRQIPANFVNVAETVQSTRFLGPGNRAVLWVRGCYTHCKGCIAPEWQSPMPERYRTVESLVKGLVIENPAVEGITISGGEPFLQAKALTNFVRLCKQAKNLNFVVYSGYEYRNLLQNVVPSAVDLLNEVDVLIDGRYEKEKNQDQGLYGSSNQQVHYLTDRLMDFDFSRQQRQVELRVGQDELYLVGVPAKVSADAYFETVNMVKENAGDALLEESEEA